MLLQILIILLQELSRPRAAKNDTRSKRFYSGKIPPSIYEHEDLNGYMTPLEGITLCEKVRTCGGFTYEGSLSLDLKFEIYFFKAVHTVDKRGIYRSWISFLREDSYTSYDGKIPRFKKELKFSKKEGYGRSPEEQCANYKKCVAFSKHSKEGSKYYSEINIRTMTSTKGWTTKLKVFIDDTESLADGDIPDTEAYCCPKAIEKDKLDANPRIYRDQIQRISCNISSENFEARYILRGIPVVLTNCTENDWAKDVDLSFGKVVKLFHSMPPSDLDYELFPTFTHSITPNDLFLDNHSIVTLEKAKKLRTFNRIRYNMNCEISMNGCQVFQRFKKPRAIPMDIFESAGYPNDFNWVIVSNAGTGSSVHIDPNLMGAWAQLLNGIKLWVIFPKGVNPSDVECQSHCSDPKSSDNTLSWFNNVLPKLRKRKFYGKSLIEAVQYPGDVIFVPYNSPHSVYNLEDNVAVTENYLFRDALPEILREIASDSIRPLINKDLDLVLFKNIYYGGIANKEDRKRMRSMYEFLVNRHFEKNDDNYCRINSIQVEGLIKRRAEELGYEEDLER